jgi:membrane peptidoglycan carboxypeptidase
VTPIQMIMAASSVANGGFLMEPHVVGAVIRDGRREPVAPKILRRTIQSDTAATLTTMMEGVVARGTATDARMDTFTVAGKTGTASKLVNGHYSQTDYNASFVGFVPSRDPVLAILVVIDSPRAGTYFGGTVAAPVFKRIADASLRYLGVPPTSGPVPPIQLNASDTRSPLPAPVRETVVIPTSAVGGTTIMPDVRGMGLRAAARALAEVGLTPHASGAGVVIAQTPGPGEAVTPGASSALALAPVSATDAAGEAP